MAPFSIRLCGNALLLTLSLTGYGYSAATSAENQQPTTSQANTTEPGQTAAAVGSNPGVYHVGGGVTAPKLVYSVEPHFSKQERKQKINGSARVQLIVETDGHVREIHIIKSAAEKYANKSQQDRDNALLLDQKFIEAVGQYRFEPGKLSGKPVPVQLNIEVNFESL
jgi:outer membrane biosynthesis protein TonB